MSRSMIISTFFAAGMAAGLAVPALAQTTTAATTAPATTPDGPQMSAPASDATPAAVPTPAPVAAPAQAGPTSPADLVSAIGKDHAAKIEAHISRLRGDLKIATAEEPAWEAFAGVMRQNAVQMDAAYVKRQQNYSTMTAVQDLESYGEVEQINARNVEQLLPPFRTLYDELTPAQKKIADGIFVRHIDKAVKKPG